MKNIKMYIVQFAHEFQLGRLRFQPLFALGAIRPLHNMTRNDYEKQALASAIELNSRKGFVLLKGHVTTFKT